MESKTKGAWIVNHTSKLQEASTSEFDDIESAGKCGLLLANLAADEDSSLSKEKVDVIGRISGLNKLETKAVVDQLIAERLAIKDGENLYVLGVTNSSILEHTTKIFDESSPKKEEQAALQLSEMISDCPLESKKVGELLSDSFKLSVKEVEQLFTKIEGAGIVDYETVDNEKVYFNGNLFKKEDVKKTIAVMETLNPGEVRVLNDFEDQLKRAGCVSLDYAKGVLGEKLLAKLHSIGMYDFNQVSNNTTNKVFITKPAAFSKYGKPFEEDALDLAKAFIASLSYGMEYSSYNRGKIYMLRALLNKLVSGKEVGPCTAIGEDYKILELKRVIQIRHDTGRMYYMKLLKRDIGILALHVLGTGDASLQSVITIASGNITNYTRPENLRTKRRKSQPKDESIIVEQLRILRNK